MDLLPKITIFETLPAGFSSKVEVAAIYVIWEDKLLLLQLSDRKVERGTWGVPAGKIENEEDPSHAAKRELFEETGIVAEAFDYLGPIYVRKPEIDYVYHMFHLQLKTMPSLDLSDEHCAFTWVTLEEAYLLPLMKAGKEALDIYIQKMREVD